MLLIVVAQIFRFNSFVVRDKAVFSGLPTGACGAWYELLNGCIKVGPGIVLSKDSV